MKEKESRIRFIIKAATAATGGSFGMPALNACRSWPSGIIYRHWFDMVTTYTVSFFGNALVESMSLSEWK